MITKTLIKYKLLEWACDAFFKGFSKLVDSKANRILFKDVSEGEYYTELITGYGSFHGVTIEGKTENCIMFAYDYFEHYASGVIRFYIFCADGKILEEKCNYSIASVSVMRANEQFKEWYGEEFYAVVDLYIEDFENHRQELENLMLVNYGELHMSPEELNSSLHFIQ